MTQGPQRLRDRRIVVVVSGGVAAYKIGYVVRDLVGQGASVRVAMTPNATRFVGPTTFQALTSHPVLTDLFEGEPDGRVEHVALAREAELAVVAPATANLLAKMASGIADDAATTLLLAMQAPILVAPAMNDGMWRNAATQENMGRLKERGIRVVGPAVGFLAEGYESVGRMVEPSEIVDSVLAYFCSGDADGSFEPGKGG